MDFQLRTAIVTGRNHILHGRNCQDALYSLTFEIDGQSYLVGVIADGCGAGQHSEVGAQLAVQYVPYALRSMLQREVTLEDMPVLLFGGLMHFLTSVVDNYSFASTRERVQLSFILKNWLFLRKFATRPSAIRGLGFSHNVA